MSGEKKYDILTVFDTCVDFLVDCGDVVPEFGQKEKLINGYSFEMGGSGCIFACQTAKLGLKTTGIGSVGIDNMGDIVLEGLSSASVDISHVRKSDEINTGLGVTLVKSDGDRSILTYMGTIDMVDGGALKALLPDTRHLHICSYYLLKSLQPAWKDIVLQAKKYGVTISLDTNWDPDEEWDGGIREILPLIDIFLPNENEIMYITGQKEYTSALKYASELVPLVVVKCGKDGAVAYHQGKTYECKALDVTVKDTVGAGDSFNGGFLYGWLNNMPIEQCLKIGTVCGSLSTQQPGGSAGQPDLKAIEGLGLSR